MALEATGILTQDSDPGSTTLIDACNGFNNLIRLTMLWMVHQHSPVGARFEFNCYMHWEQLFLRQTGGAPVILLIREGFTQGNPHLMVLYGITLVPLS